MNQKMTDKGLACGEWNNKRIDWISADIVERGIEMQTDYGYEQAVGYLLSHEIPFDVIERVLLSRSERRTQISGSL